MANATNDVKKHADFITLSNTEHGVAHAIQKFVLKP
jgi:hydroxymethylpyrimidine pyrophosphatase-like HAD family hydrolase